MVTQYITRIGVLSFGTIAGTANAILGFVQGAFIILASFGRIPIVGVGRASVELLGGFGAIIFLPIFGGVLGFIFGIIAAFVYNVAIGFVGGLEIELENELVLK